MAETPWLDPNSAPADDADDADDPMDAYVAEGREGADEFLAERYGVEADDEEQDPAES